MFYSDDPTLHGAFNTHRVVAVIGDHAAFTTKGDHNVAPDAVPAAGEKVVGRYVRNMPLMTLLGRLFRSVAGLVILFALAAASVAVTVAGRRKKPQNAEKTADFDALVAAEVERLRAAEEQKKAENKPLDDTPENTPDAAQLSLPPQNKK